MAKKPVKTAFLLAAGLGKRLRPLTSRVPKPLLPVCGEAVIIHAMRHCISIGVERFIINIHHLPESFETAFPEESWDGHPITFVYEKDRLETGTGLKNIENLLEEDETILVYNSDILCDIPLKELWEKHRQSDALVTLAATPFGKEPHLHVNEKNELLRVIRTKELDSSKGLNYLGIHLVDKDFFRFLNKTKRESIIHGWNRAVEERSGAVQVHPYQSGRWTDIGTIEAYEESRGKGLQKKHELCQYAEPR